MTEDARPLVMVMDGVPESSVPDLAARWRIIDVRGSGNDLAAHVLAQVRGIAATGRAKIDDALLARMPALKIIASYSAGLDGIDLEAAARRGVPVTGTSDQLADEVADTALGLLLMMVRGLGRAETYLRAGHWPKAAFPLASSIARKRVGIIGLGRIGAAFARRASVLGAEIGYTGRAAKPGRSEPFFADVARLAAWCDVLVATCAGGAATRHLVGAEALRQLGAGGYVLNVSRGSVVDTEALIDALAGRRIAGAALDVFDNEPAVDARLLELPNVVLTPHVGSSTLETRAAMGAAMLASLTHHLGLP